MKIISRSFALLAALALALVIWIYASGNDHLLRAVKTTYMAGHTTANVDDHRNFDTKPIISTSPALLANHANYKDTPVSDALQQYFNRDSAFAYVALKNGEVIREQYFDGYDDRSKTNSFSMAKTITTLLLGIMVDEGLIESIDQPIADFFPELADQPLAANVTLANLSAMDSGYAWDENYYNAFSPTVKLYFGHDVVQYLLEGEFDKPAGTYFYYSSASTQLLGAALNRALSAANTGTTLSEYLSNKLWIPMQMNDDALWHTDAKGNELAYCCINTNARNFARLGQLMLQNGAWNNQQLVPADFITEMVKPRLVEHYGLSTWLNWEHQPGYYWFSGHLGQYIVIVPDEDLVVVALNASRQVPVLGDSYLPTLVKETLRSINPSSLTQPKQ